LGKEFNLSLIVEKAMKKRLMLGLGASFLLFASVPFFAARQEKKHPAWTTDWVSMPVPEAAPATLHDTCLQIIRDSTLYNENWDTLPQPRFWRHAMRIGPDSVIVNRASNRQILGYMTTDFWNGKNKKEKKQYEDSIRSRYGMLSSEEIYFTTGRSHFYRFREVLPQIDEAIPMFTETNVDPWYAQSILLIESPGRLEFSTDGAYGAFQLLKGVARDMGLVVNDSVDERAEFDRSACGAARLIHEICLPYTRDICREMGLSYREDELWFRLLVMHVYHAGAGNVRKALRKSPPRKGGPEVILGLWKTDHRRFGNASRNYSQIILAAQMELFEILSQEGIRCPGQ
jgi:hypothetical protein